MKDPKCIDDEEKILGIYRTLKEGFPDKKHTLFHISVQGWPDLDEGKKPYNSFGKVICRVPVENASESLEALEIVDHVLGEIWGSKESYSMGGHPVPTWITTTHPVDRFDVIHDESMIKGGLINTFVDSRHPRHGESMYGWLIWQKVLGTIDLGHPKIFDQSTDFKQFQLGNK